MSDMFSFLMALFFLWAGVVCIQHPQRIAEWLSALFKAGGSGYAPPPMLSSAGTLWFIRIMGFLSLINFAAQMYMLIHPEAAA